jgi:hypothetical protein
MASLKITYRPDGKIKNPLGSGFVLGVAEVEIIEGDVSTIVKHRAKSEVDAKRIAGDYESLYKIEPVFQVTGSVAPMVDVEQKMQVSRKAPRRAVVGGRSVSID